MKKILLQLVAIAMATTLFAQNSPNNGTTKYSNDKPAYVIYNSSGEMIPFSQMFNELLSTQVCLFGELHNDPISHWMELTLVKEFYKAKGRDLVVGAEMWESDNQLLLDETLEQGLVDGPSYMESSKLWPNVETDYLPILQYAKSNKIRFVATNIPRRYARIIYKKGLEYLDSLTPQAKSYFPPLPIHFNLEEGIYKSMAAPFPTDQEYEAMKASGKGGHGAMSSGKPSNLVKAQAVKDATMAHFILKNMKENSFFFHFHGELHSAHHTAIYYYLNHYRPGIKIKTISIIKQEDNMTFDKENIRADYMIVVPENMTVTYNQ